MCIQLLAAFMNMISLLLHAVCWQVVEEMACIFSMLNVCSLLLNGPPKPFFCPAAGKTLASSQTVTALPLVAALQAQLKSQRSQQALEQQRAIPYLDAPQQAIYCARALPRTSGKLVSMESLSARALLLPDA
jgi:hypothetical protein